jgi:hypothetical protein
MAKLVDTHVWEGWEYPRQFATVGSDIIDEICPGFIVVGDVIGAWNCVISVVDYQCLRQLQRF